MIEGVKRKMVRRLGGFKRMGSRDGVRMGEGEDDERWDEK
jgi:hypothetical protein